MKKLKLDKDRIVEIIRTKWWLFLIEAAVLAFIITLDLCMKDYLSKLLSTKPNKNMTLIGGFLDLTYSANTGAGFGMFKSSTLALTVITGIVIGGILIYLIFFHKEKEGLRIPLIFIAAGGIGNLVDRIMLGYVRDFFEFTFVKFAIFNIADAFVTIGAIWLVIYLIYMMSVEAKKNKKKFEEAVAGAENKEFVESINAENAEAVDNLYAIENAENVAESEKGAANVTDCEKGIENVTSRENAENGISHEYIENDSSLENIEKTVGRDKNEKSEVGGDKQEHAGAVESGEHGKSKTDTHIYGSVDTDADGAPNASNLFGNVLLGVDLTGAPIDDPTAENKKSRFKIEKKRGDDEK